MSNSSVVGEQLKKIEDIFQRYFIEHKKSVFDCVEIKGNHPAVVVIIDDSLPADIQFIIHSVNNFIR